jgi:hypothetical protein
LLTHANFANQGAGIRYGSSPTLHRGRPGIRRGYWVHWRRQAWARLQSLGRLSNSNRPRRPRCWRLRRPETPHEEASREADRAKMSGMQRHWICRGGAANAAGPQNLSSAVPEMRWQGPDKTARLRASRKARLQLCSRSPPQHLRGLWLFNMTALQTFEAFEFRVRIEAVNHNHGHPADRARRKTVANVSE